MTTHTPGPWKVETSDTHGIEILGDGDIKRYVAKIHDWTTDAVAPQYEAAELVLATEREANAKLIAAAPQLLEALEQAMEHGLAGGCGGDCETVNRARAAIKEATQ